MKQKKNNIISVIKTKIGNFLLELDKENIIRFMPTKKEALVDNFYAEKVENYINEYFDGKRKYFYFKIKPNGTYFQKKVWHEVSKIKYGDTNTYYDISIKLNTSPRAVGNASIEVLSQ